MASSSSSSKTSCATCGNKDTGIFRCEGCLQVFCRKHLIEHRDILNHQLDEIVLEHDTLQQTILENKNKQDNQHPIVKQIDQWEKDATRKVQQLADELRQQVKELNNSQKASTELHDLAKQLQKARVDDDYVETDLQRWTTILHNLKDDLNTFSPSICIEEDPTQILVTKMFLISSKEQLRQNERFGKADGNVHIEENGLVAIHSGLNNSTVYVRGIGEYSTGTHKIRFLLKKNSIDFISRFEVVSKLMSIPDRKSKSSYVYYGWKSNDSMCTHNAELKTAENFRDMIGETTFEIELELDCDNRKISYVNQRTKNRRELDVDITKCPFPWQIQFYLYEVGDCVRFLP